VLVDAAGIPLVEDGVDPFMLSPEALLRASYADAAHIPVPDDEARAQFAKNALMTARMAWQPRYYDPQLAKWLHRLRLPTLVVWGKHDAIFPVRQAAEYAAAIPGAKTALIDGAGHLPHVETPHAFAAAVNAFADGIPT
jgi:pimeloyl-ACP methyl ester carboxylesterase